MAGKKDIPRVRNPPSGDEHHVNLGEGVNLIWTPAIDGSDILGIPALEAVPQASQAPHIGVYPPTKAANDILGLTTRYCRNA